MRRTSVLRSKTLPEAEFISAEDLKKMGPPQARACGECPAVAKAVAEAAKATGVARA